MYESKESAHMKKVITYGTFDLFHQGHYNILKRAKEYGDYLVVGVTGDNYDIGRGKLSVQDSIATRIENVKKTGLADEIIVEEYLGQKIGDIIEHNIDTFVIGDDWRGKFDHLSKYCDIVYLERTKNISSTQLREELFSPTRIGILTDMKDDNQIVRDAAGISEFEMSGVYCEDADAAEEFRDKYGLEAAFASKEELFENSDVVYIRTNLKSRYYLIREALNAGKHVICDPPFTRRRDQQEELFRLAGEKKQILLDNVKMVHVNVFNQLMWMCHGGLIGDVVSFNCSVSKNDKNVKDLFDGLLFLVLTPMIKIMGMDYESFSKNIVRGEDGVIEFGSATFVYPRGEAYIKVGNTIRVENQMEIIGTKGTIHLSDRWWKSDYFELEYVDKDEKQIFNMNFEGNGFKFLLRSLANMIKNNRYESMGLFNDESIKISEILEEMDR